MSDTTAKPEIALNYGYALKINTTPESETSTMAEIKKGFDNITEALNEVLYQASFLGDGGYGSTEVVGGQLTVTLTGMRYVGDAAQDYIFSDAVYYNWGKARKTDVEMSCPDGTAITCPVTLAKISRSGGAANNGTAISVEIHFNGKPNIKSGAASASST
ncbi:MAG: capsid protein [Ruminococcus sp.]|nr:capsid protein [Ruminococcus sp.]